ncbi:oxidoreductase [soil metagenome]
MRTAIIAGATGLIGKQVLELLIADGSYGKIIAITRKPLLVSNSKLQNLVMDFADLSTNANQLKGDDVFCCLGTTIKQAGSKEAFRKVDFEYPVNLAKLTNTLGAKQFLLITALGAEKKSSVFYNKVKGEVEEEIEKIGFESYHIFQPSMLIGVRTDERAAERVGQSVMKVLDFAIPKKYKAIESGKVARAMVKIALQNQKGKHIHASSELQSF